MPCPARERGVPALQQGAASSAPTTPRKGEEMGMDRLQDRVCIVTGAAQGIGKGIARRFLEEGASVWIGDIRAEGVENAVAELAPVGRVAGGVTDVSKRD